MFMIMAWEWELILKFSSIDKLKSLNICLPLVFYVDNPQFQNVLAHTLLSHGHECSAADNKVCLVIPIEISQSHYSSFFGTMTCVLASYLPNMPQSKQSFHNQ